MQMPWEISSREVQLRSLARQIVGSKKAKALILAFDGKCYYCRQPVEALGHNHPRHPTRDHKTPVVRNGDDSSGNIVLACRACNCVKGDMNESEFNHFIETGEFAASYIEWLTVRRRRQALGRGLRLQTTR